MPRSEDRGTIAGRATIAGLGRDAQTPAPDLMRGGNRSGQAEAKRQASGRRGSRRMKYHCKAVHAVAQAGRLRTIAEDVAEMAAAAAAVNFGAQHPQGAVFGLADGVLE